MNPILLDKRTIDRNIKKGALTKDEYEKHVKSLPDLTEECEPIEVSLYETEEQETEASEEDEQPAEVAPEGQNEG